jgi:hypothetical protein
MATIRQKRVAKALVENLQADKPQNAGEVLKSVGYGTGLQNQPKRVFESEGVRTELKAIGFDPERAKEIVGEILENAEQDRDRLKAADMIFKVHSTYAPEKSLNVNVNTDTGRTDIAVLAQKAADLLKEQITNDTDTGTT